jgi:hypothetical protein
MSVRFKQHSRFALVGLSVLCLMAVWQIPLQADTISGQDIYYHGGSLQFEIMPYEAVYTSQIYLHTASETIFLGSSSSTGRVISISDPSVLGLSPGDEFVLGIHVLNTGDKFLMGGAYNNSDGTAHARVNYTPGQTVIGFEDLLGGGDLDYDDAVIRVTGNIGGSIGVAEVPEPSTLVLCGLGVAGLMCFGRRRLMLRRR